VLQLEIAPCEETLRPLRRYQLHQGREALLHWWYQAQLWQRQEQLPGVKMEDLFRAHGEVP